MSEQIPYYKNLAEPFSANAIGVNNPDFEIMRFEDIPHETMLKNKPFRLNAFVVGLVTGGQATLMINSQEHRLSAGTMYFSAPWHIRQYSDIKDWTGYILFFTPQFIFDHYNTENIAREYPFYQFKDGLSIQPARNDYETAIFLLSTMRQELISDAVNKYKILYHYLNILLLRAKEITAAIELPQGGGTSIAGKFFDYINQYFISLNKGDNKKELSLKQAALDLFLHPNYLSNLIKTQTGKSAAGLIRERTALEAQALLKNTGMTVAEIAYYLQFKDTSNFAKFFKSMTGMSPTDFRAERKNSV